LPSPNTACESIVLTGNERDLRALAANTEQVRVARA
jgi:hypothetical protein